MVAANVFFSSREIELNERTKSTPVTNKHLERPKSDSEFVFRSLKNSCDSSRDHKNTFFIGYKNIEQYTE